MGAYPLLSPSELASRLHERDLRGIALDIDDTLSITDLSWYGAVHARLGGFEGLTVRDIMTSHPRLDAVPSWDRESIFPIFEELMHSADFHHRLPLITGADDAVRELARWVPVVAYVSARPETIHDATRAWLERHGFPDAPLVLRPADTPIQSKNSWKAEVLHALYPRVTGIVDDQVSLFDQLKGMGYRGRHYLYDNGHTTQDFSGYDAARSWDDLVAAIKRDHASA